MNKAFAERIFTTGEIKIIEQQQLKNKVKNIAYCSFENRFAKSGGLAAVVNSLLPYLASEANVILLTPFYSANSNFLKGQNKELVDTNITVNVPFYDRDIKVNIYKYTWKFNNPGEGIIEEFYLKADGFFEAENFLNDPYIYDVNDIERNNQLLFRDTVFFCKAVPYVMEALGIKENIIFHLQEWQTALITLTSKEAIVNKRLESCKCTLTMHNTFDSFITDDGYFRYILSNLVDKERSSLINTIVSPEKHSAFSFALEFLDTPITTVSENFAKEFTNDKIQTIWFAGHLQNNFNRSEIIGVNNGKFIDYPAEIKEVLRNSDIKGKTKIIAKIKKIKSDSRKELLKILDEYKPQERFGELTFNNKPIINLPDDVPIFLMSGRLDPSQKGYDIFLRAIEKLGGINERAKFILTPMPIRDSDLNYFRKVSSECKGNLTVFPIRMARGYKELQLGCSYGVMPSVYEPFGAAIEYMVNGTVNIARATGGLVNQITDNKNGLLFLENSASKTDDEIRKYFSFMLNVESRFYHPDSWAEAMADSLLEKINYAIRIFNTETYYNMVIHGFEKAKEFDWMKSSKKYFSVFKKNHA